MDDNAVQMTMSTIRAISNNLDTRPESWREQLPSVRYTTSTFEILDTVPSPARRQWQLPLVSVFQRVAFGDADNEPVQDVADWCLRQGLRMLHLYPEDTEILSLIGRNWLSRAQKSLANIYRADRGSSSSSSAASTSALQDSEATRRRALAEAEQALNTADYVEARGILSPAVDYLQRAVNAAYARGIVSGTVLVNAAEAYMSIGNVTSTRVNETYFRQAMLYLRAASSLQGYSLPEHLQQYLDDYGHLYLTT